MKNVFCGAVETYPTDHTSIQYDHKQRRYRQNSKKINMGFRQSDDTKIGSTRLIRQLFSIRNQYILSSSSLLGEPTYDYWPKKWGGVNQNIFCIQGGKWMGDDGIGAGR